MITDYETKQGGYQPTGPHLDASNPPGGNDEITLDFESLISTYERLTGKVITRDEIVDMIKESIKSHGVQSNE